MYAHAMDAGTHGPLHLPRRNVSSEERAAQECERKRCSTSMYHEKLQFIFFHSCPALIISPFFFFLPFYFFFLLSPGNCVIRTRVQAPAYHDRRHDLSAHAREAALGRYACVENKKRESVLTIAFFSFGGGVARHLHHRLPCHRQSMICGVT